MRVILLHLSDIHIRSGSNPIITRVKNIADALNICTDEECVCFLVVSGDIANLGNSKEYDIAYEFISDLLQEIRLNNKISQVYPILVPGNHDCNFANVKSTRRDLIDHLHQIDKPYDHIDNDYIHTLTSIQKEYFTFAQKLDSIDQQTNPIFWLREYEIDPYHVHFLCFNTAWMSTKPEEQGRLIFPVNLINFNEIHSDKNTVTVSVFHHPYDWFDSRHVKDFKNLIHSSSNIIITGHEHDIDNQTNISIKGTIQEVMQGGLLQYHEKTDSSFNIEIIDIQNRLQKKCLLVWDDPASYYRPEHETTWLPFSSLQTGNTFSLREDFKRSLTRLDVQITNPKSLTLLEIDDIYVDRSLDIDYAKHGIISRHPQTTKDINDLLKVIKEYRKILILGNKYYGKSLLLKKLFTFLFKDDFVPLYCRDRDLLQLGKQTESAIRHLFEKHYENDKDVPYQKYRQLPFDKKVILIDDLNNTGLDINKIEAILNKIQSYFGIVVIASHPIISVNEIFNNPGALIDYTRVKLNDFGLPIVSDLVEKWTRLIHPDSSETEVQHKIKTLENTLFNEISRDITPRNPFFILTILHKLETEKSPEAQTGSHGYYFQTIINVMIAKVVAKPSLIGYVYDYFSNLAFQMLDNRTGKIDEADLGKINESYLERTGFTLDLQQVIRNSIREEILLYEDNSYSFARNYYFEFFAAKYIADNIRSPRVQEHMFKTIEQISLHIHKEVYANIMMFLCFHSKDPIILDLVTKKAQQIFSDIGKFDIHKDVEFLNKLSPQTKIHYLSEKSTKETKKELLEASDAIISEIGEVRYSLLQDVTNIEELSIVDKILYAFSSVQVLGQIIKRYLPGDFEDRITLTRECYDLGLHTIKYVFDQIGQEISSVQEEVALCILERNPSIMSEELSSATNGWIWLLCESICMSSMKNISHNVGAPELQKVYKEILDRYPDIAYEFIDISIELDHFEELPESKIVKLAKKLDESKNYFCKDLLSLLFIYHIYQFYTPMRQIQRIASALGLERILTEPNIFLPGKKMLPRK